MLDAEVGELALRGRADAPQPADRQRVQECELGAGLDDEQAVGLGQASLAIFASILVVATPTDAVRASSARMRLPERGRDLRAGAEQAGRAGDVEERLVERQRLHQRRRRAQDRHHLAAHVRVDGRAAAATKAASGHSRRARAVGIALWMPNRRAS